MYEKYLLLKEHVYKNNLIEFLFIGVIGAIDGCHVKVKVLLNQQDSYTDRYLQHSINLMGVCTSEKIFTYVFIGFPGSAHDSRVCK